LRTGASSRIPRGWKLLSKSARSTITGGTVLNQDFKEFIQLLNANLVRYLVVGGYAVALHGHPRYTKDLDIWIDMTHENAEKLIKSLDQFGFGSLDLKAGDFLVPDQIIQLGYPPSRIDLMNTLSGVDFSSCYSSRAQIDIDGTQVSFIDLENLKKNKQATGRHQDLADLENLT
jgi:predicted nucleotidyltransferase